MVLVKKERESNFELLRLIAMIFIVLYHFCSSVKAGIDTENRWILLGYTIFHIGVPVFILISGYWTIKLSIRKLISFYLYCFLWYLMCYGISVLFLGEEFILKERFYDAMVSLQPYRRQMVHNILFLVDVISSCS